MRHDVTFTSASTRCRGWLYLPDGHDSGQRHPAVAMAHGFAGVKEMDLPAFAERFAAAGVAVLLFDYRGFGASDGEPRQRLDPAMQIEDYRNALSWLQEHPAVDEQRLGVWGTSFSGAHAIHLGAFDSRVKCVVSQVPAMDVPANARRLMSTEVLSVIDAAVQANRRAMFTGAPPATMPVVAPADQLCILPSAESFDMLMAQHATVAPAWRNELTVDSFERIMEYRPACSIELVAPTPLLMIVACRDGLTPPDIALEAFDRAGEPKQLVTFDGGHYDAYGQQFERCVEAATEWFLRHLCAVTTIP